MENKKFTNREMFAAIREVFATGESDMDPSLMIEFCDAKIASIDRKAERAKERAEKRKTEEDELMKLVKDCLTDEPTTVSAITLAVNIASNEEEYSWQKVGHRLRQLVAEGFAVVEDSVFTKETGRKSVVKTYRRAN